MKRIGIREFLLAMLVAVLVVIVARAWQRRSAADTKGLADVPELIGGSLGYEAFQKSDQVLAYRISHPEDVRSITQDFPVIAGRVAVPAEVRDEFRTSVLPRRFLGVTGCAPEYAVRIDFVKGEHTLRFLICLHCNSIVALLDGQECTARPDKLRLDFNEEQMIEVAKKLFPNDQRIQELKS
ncbi:hypothetical protein [Anatilimnocola floriformis]|uniref:hypothetical protein n=1 Tax=Anatilimnocola floriformis TaxID=2948575 RepID=UPI0020C4E95C|nr:hypothetical protein [Anatilimnocola floriformis]